jgi:DNA adenine methylase
MRPIFVRIGSKYNIRDFIIQKFPKNFNSYCEPFCGSSAIFFNLDLDGKKVILNDVDKELIQAYKLVKEVIVDKMPILYNKNDMQKLIDKSSKTNEEKLMAYMYRTSNSFMSVDADYLFHENSLETKVKKIPEYKEKLKDVKLLHDDALDVIRRFDNEGMLFFIDPPYENSKRLYDAAHFDYDKLASTLTNIRGKFVLTVNASTVMRNTFKNFNISSFTVKSSGMGRIGGKNRKELLVKNF